MYSISNAESRKYLFNDTSIIPTLLNNISDAFLLLDANWQFIYANPKAEKFFNKTNEDLIQQRIFNVFPFEKGSNLFLRLSYALSRAEKVSERFFSLQHLATYKLTAYPFHNGFAILITEDGSEFATVDEKFSGLQAAVDSLPQIVWISSPTGEITCLNKKWTDYTGKSVEESVGYQWLQFIHPEDVEQLKAGWARSVEMGVGLEHEYRLRGADGIYRWHLDRNKAVYDGENKISMWIGTTTEIHKQKLAQEELKEKNHLVQKITEASPDVIAVFDVVNDKYVYVSDVIMSFLNISREDFLKMRRDEVLALIHPDDHQQYLNFKNIFIKAADNEVKEVEFRIKNGDKKWIWLSTRAKVFKRDKENNVTQITGITQNISKQKEAEDQQIKNSILHSLLEKKEEFVSIASHELKAPVAKVKASTQILKRLIEKETDKETLLVFASKANQQIGKLTELIKHLLENAKLGAGRVELKVSSFPVAEVLNEAISHIINSHRIMVHNSVSEQIRGDKNKIEQVIINFLTNALKYSPDTNSVILKAERVRDSIKISVTDSGVGIPKEKTKHVFERFYRVGNTSLEYSGLGLGLYICAEIIKLHKGEYGVISEEGKGSTFWFTVPLL